MVDGYVPQYPIVLNGNDMVFAYIAWDELHAPDNVSLTINEDVLTIADGNMENDIAYLMYGGELWRADPVSGFLPRNHYGNRVTIIPV